MLKNLFGGKKSDFYLELKETDGEQQATATTAAAAPVVEAPAAAVESAAAPVAENKTKKTSGSDFWPLVHYSRNLTLHRIRSISSKKDGRCTRANIGQI